MAREGVHPYRNPFRGGEEMRDAGFAGATGTEAEHDGALLRASVFIEPSSFSGGSRHKRPSR